MKSVIYSAGMALLVLFQFGCSKEDDRTSSLSVHINGTLREAVQIEAEENTFSGGFPLGSGQFLVFTASFDDPIVNNVSFSLPGLGLQLHSLTYEGVFHVFAGAGNTFGQGVTPVDTSDIKYRPISGLMEVTKHQKSDKWIKGTFDIEWVNDLKDTITLTDGSFKIYYE